MRVFSQGGHTKHRREWNTRTVPGLGFRRHVVRPWTVPNLGMAVWTFELWTGSNMGSSDLEFRLDTGPIRGLADPELAYSSSLGLDPNCV